MFKVKATVISTRASEILKLLQPKFDGTSRQDRLKHWKDFLAFMRETENMAWVTGVDCCHSWPSRYLKQGSALIPIKKMWKEHCFCNEYTCLLNILVSGSSVWTMILNLIQLTSYSLLYLLWCLHNMWDRLLIKCDWFLTLKSKKQISLWL